MGILNGIVHVGLDNDQLHRLSENSTERSKIKVSRRDLVKAVTSKYDGGTTVSGTLAIGSMLGKQAMPLFVTGGIGGVHREGENTMDVSADLVEMGRTSTAVISAGVKSILDIGRTLEYLETNGVCVATLGDDHDFPAFFTRKSGFQSPHRFQDISEASAFIRNHNLLNMSSGVLVAVPIPEHASAEGEIIEQAIKQALYEANARNVTGKEVTPFILKRVNELTEGASLKANLALIENNARVGAQIASDMAKNREDIHLIGQVKKPTVIGGSNVDITTSTYELSDAGLNGSTKKGSVKISYGGVGRNVADALARLDIDPNFISAVGKDDIGKCLLGKMSYFQCIIVSCYRYNKISGHSPKLRTNHVQIIDDAPSATYNVFTENGDVKYGIGDMNIHSQITPEVLLEKISVIKNSSLVLLDGNLSKETLHFALKLCHDHKVPVFFEPADVNKAKKVVDLLHLNAIDFISPNIYELQTLSGRVFTVSNSDNLNYVLDNTLKACDKLLNVTKVLLVTLGKHGVVLARHGKPEDPLYPPPPQNQQGIKSYRYYPIENVLNAVCSSGAGDCFVGAFLRAILDGLSQDQAVSAGIQAAAISLVHFEAVPTNLTHDAIDWKRSASGKDI